MKLMMGDCLELMADIPDGSVDMILCDLPYGTTACKWDSVIPFGPLWAHYRRVIKGNCAIVLFGQEPFSSKLRLSAVDDFKYDFYWRKSRPTGFTCAKLRPLKDVEVISVFSRGATANGSSRNMPYNPQGLVKVDKKWRRPKGYVGADPDVSFKRDSHSLDRVIEFEGYPRQILEFPNPNNDQVHPTQKPVALMEYLIKTYTNPGDVVMDNCMGSGTTGVACINADRRFVGIERDPEYFNVSQVRITEAMVKRMTAA